MLKLRPQQLDQLLQQDIEDFIERLLQLIADNMPEEIRGIPPALLREQIRLGIRKAWRYGLTSDEQVMAFVAVMFEIAPNFDREPVLQRVLQDTQLVPARRWDALFADTPELNAAWERAAHPGFYDANAWLGDDADDNRR